MGHINSHRVNRRIGGPLFSGLVAISEAAGLVDHPRSYAVPGASIPCQPDWWKTKAHLGHYGDPWTISDRRPDLVADELIR